MKIIYLKIKSSKGIKVANYPHRCKDRGDFDLIGAIEHGRPRLTVRRVACRHLGFSHRRISEHGRGGYRHACCSVFVPTEIFAFDIRLGGDGSVYADRGRMAVAS